MVPIQIHMLHGPSAGRARLFDEPQLAFGRAPDNHIVVDIPEASRYHGALVFEQDHWAVANNSPNDTTVNGKAIGKKRPALKTGDEIGVGKTQFFVVEILTPAQPATTTATTEAAVAVKQKKPMSGRNKLWIGLGIYFFAMLVAFIVLTQLAGNKSDRRSPSAPYLTDELIEQEIIAPLSLSPSDRDAQEAIKQALTQYQQIEVETAARYQAYRQFKRADVLSQGQLYKDPADAQAATNYRLYKKCERDLIDLVIQQYRLGYDYLRAGQSEQAERVFRKLLEIYPDYSSEIYRNVSKQVLVARSKRKK